MVYWIGIYLPKIQSVLVRPRSLNNDMRWTLSLFLMRRRPCEIAAMRANT